MSYDSAKPLSSAEMHNYFEFEDNDEINLFQQPTTIKISKVIKELPKVVIFPSHVDNKKLILPDSCNYLFSRNNSSSCVILRSCEYINFSNIVDTSNIKSMSGMFYMGNALQKVVFGKNFNSFNVIDMSFMFKNCLNLTDIDLDNLQTNKVTTMTGMFQGCSVIKYLDVSDFFTANVTDMSSMFKGCKSLCNIKMFSNTDKCTNMAFMFSGCNSLNSLDLSHHNLLDTSKVQDFRYMFFDCKNLRKLDIDNFSFKSVETMNGDIKESKFGLYNMFLGCNNIENITLKYGFDTLYDAKECKSLNISTLIGNTDNDYLESKLQNYINVVKGIKSNVGNNRQDNAVKQGLSSIINRRTISRSASKTKQKVLNTANKVTSGISGVTDIGAGILSNKELIHYFGFQCVKSREDILCISKVRDQLPEKVIIPEKMKLPNQDKEVHLCLTGNCLELFKNQSNLKYIDLSHIEDISNIYNMSDMFSNCTSLREVVFTEKSKTPRLMNTTSMFSGCTSLVYINIKGFTVDRVIRTEEMFKDCKSVIKADLPDFSGSKIGDYNLQDILDTSTGMSNYLYNEIKSQIDKRKADNRISENLDNDRLDSLKATSFDSGDETDSKIDNNNINSNAMEE